MHLNRRIEASQTGHRQRPRSVLVVERHGTRDAVVRRQFESYGVTVVGITGRAAIHTQGGVYRQRAGRIRDCDFKKIVAVIAVQDRGTGGAETVSGDSQFIGSIATIYLQNRTASAGDDVHLVAASGTVHGCLAGGSRGRNGDEVVASTTIHGEITTGSGGRDNHRVSGGHSIAAGRGIDDHRGTIRRCRDLDGIRTRARIDREHRQAGGNGKVDGKGVVSVPSIDGDVGLVGEVNQLKAVRGFTDLNGLSTVNQAIQDADVLVLGRSGGRGDHERVFRRGVVHRFQAGEGHRLRDAAIGMLNHAGPCGTGGVRPRIAGPAAAEQLQSIAGGGGLSPAFETDAARWSE